MGCPQSQRILQISWELLPHGALFNAFQIIGTLEDGVDVDARRVNLIWGQVTGLNELFDLGDDVIRSGGHHGIEVTRGFAEDEIAPAVSLPGLDESKIAAQGALQHEVAAVEFTRLFAVGDHGAVTGGRVKRRNASAARSQALCESALRIQLHLQFAAQNELFE